LSPVRKLYSEIRSLLDEIPPQQPPRIALWPHAAIPGTSTSSSAYPFRKHTREEWLSYAENASMHSLEATFLSEYRKFCTLFRFIPQETDFTLNRLYIELYDRLLGLEYSRHRRGNPADTVV